MPGFTTKDLEDELVPWLEALLEQVRLKDPTGEFKSPKIYKHDLPVPMTDDDSELSYYPYVIIRVTGGKISDWNADLTKALTVQFLIGVYDNDPERKGHDDVLNIIQRIENKLGTTRRVNNFALGSDFQFALGDTDTHPYYFGGIQTTFEAARTIKEDPLA